MILKECVGKKNAREQISYNVRSNDRKSWKNNVSNNIILEKDSLVNFENVNNVYLLNKYFYPNRKCLNRKYG